LEPFTEYSYSIALEYAIPEIFVMKSNIGVELTKGFTSKEEGKSQVYTNTII